MKGQVFLLVLAAGQQLTARSVRGKINIFNLFHNILCTKDINRRRSENEDSSEESSEELEDSGNYCFMLL